jgi:hypothetical protein
VIAVLFGSERTPDVVVFPLLSTLISLACAAVIARDAIRSPRPYKIVWTIAFLAFAVGAAAKAASEAWEWTPLLARIFYLSGAVLVVFYLAIGELYLLAGKRVAPYAPGVFLLVTAVSAAAVFNASIDDARIKTDGWQAMDRGNGLGALAAILNSVSTLVLVGGVLYSAWRFKKLGIQRHRMIGLTLIAVGTIMIALGGTATRLGHEEYYYVVMSFGVAIIFAGYLQTRRPDAHPAAVPAAPVSQPIRATANGSTPSSNGSATTGPFAPVNTVAVAGAGAAAVQENHHEPTPHTDPTLAFIETRLLPMTDADLVEECRVWSAAPRLEHAFSRDEARQVWALRTRLSPTAQAQFDDHSVSARLQLSELYHEVLSPAEGRGGVTVRRRVIARRGREPLRRSPAVDV